MVSFEHSRHVSWPAPTSYVGPVEVRRPLPIGQVKSVGPFVLLDHFGPVPAPPGKLPAHPHAGIEVMTYLIDGANEHTDSLGNIGQIGAGGAQWMKSGRGILHTERNLVDRASTMHGLQIWARLPIEQQDDAPDYRAFQAEEMARWNRDCIDFNLISGDLEGQKGPLSLALPSIMAHVSLHRNSSALLQLPNTKHEYAFYVISAEDGVWLDESDHVPEGGMIRLVSGVTEFSLANKSSEPAELFLLGGEPAPQPLVFGGSYVLDSPEAIQAADQRYRLGAMGTLDGVPF
ncbi:MAG: pirin family protein [Pseudomonadota bacterium]